MEEQNLTEKNAPNAASVSDVEAKHDERNWLSRNTVEMTRTRLSSKSPLDLHRRCAETIERCSARLRERQRKMERLDLVLPLPNAGHHKEDSRTKRSTPPRPTKRNKRSAGPVRSREKNALDITSPAWSTSPLRFDAMTTSPMINRNTKTQAKVKLRVSPNMTENEKIATQEPTPASTDKSTDSQEKSTLLSPTWSQRQQDFMAAIEAEAGNDSISMTP